jgi:phosphoribosyl 1,2-cyclic phosphodiesterase
MRFCILRSGSSANCTFVEHGDTRLLIDAGGMSRRGLSSVLQEIGVALSQIQAIVVTHLHSDHIDATAARLSDDYGIPLYTHETNDRILRTFLERTNASGARIVTFSRAGFSVDEIGFSPFVVSHDARKTTCGFVFFPVEAPESRVSFATDLGCFPDDMLPHFADSACIVLEANHDTAMLWNNPRRPYANKVRVASDSGHLSNEQAAFALVKICTASRTPPRVVVLSHLSKEHNSIALAVNHVASTLASHGFSPHVCVAFRDRRTEFIECR